jgi:hypothetical protein
MEWIESRLPNKQLRDASGPNIPDLRQSPTFQDLDLSTRQIAVVPQLGPDPPVQQDI